LHYPITSGHVDLNCDDENVSCLCGFGLKLTLAVPQLINLSVAQIKYKCGFGSMFSTYKERKKKRKKNYKMLKIKA